MQVLALTKSLKELSGNFKGLVDSYYRFGFNEIEAFYTDNVAADKKILEEFIPSLRRDVRPLVVDKSTGISIFANSPALPLLVLPDGINIELTADAEKINRACQDILNLISLNGGGECFVGFDCAWALPQFKEKPSPVALVQIYSEELNTIFLFRIYGISKNTFPVKLQELIASKRVRKVGRSISGDLKRLEHFVPKTGGGLELSTYCFDRNAISSSKKSLSDICCGVLGFDLAKVDTHRKSNWEATELTDAQKKYSGRAI